MRLKDRIFRDFPVKPNGAESVLSGAFRRSIKKLVFYNFIVNFVTQRTLNAASNQFLAISKAFSRDVKDYT